VDAVADVGAILPEQAADLARAPRVVLLRREVATTHYLLFNCGKSPFSERPARLWLASILDRAQMVTALAHGAGVVARDPYSRLARDWAFGLLDPPPGRKPPVPARELVILLHRGTTQRWPYLEIAQVLHQKLSGAGFRAVLRIKEPGAYYEAMEKGEFDLSLQPNTLMTGDPDFFYTYYVHSRGPRSFACGGSTWDRLIEEARFEMDFRRRQALYRRLAERFNQELPLLPLYHDISLYAHRDNVMEFRMDQNFRPSLDRARPNLVHLSRRPRLHVEVGRAAQFFEARSATFGKEGSNLRRAVLDAFPPHERQGIIELQAEASAAHAHWSKEPGR